MSDLVLRVGCVLGCVQEQEAEEREEAERKLREEQERQARLDEVARKQREREAELEEKKRREREAIIAGAARTSPAPSPEKPDSSATGSGGGYVPPTRRAGGEHELPAALGMHVVSSVGGPLIGQCFVDGEAICCRLSLRQ